MNETIQNILKKTYNSLKQKEVDSPCYICSLLKEDHKPTIKAHSISRANNFLNKKWYNWEQSLKNLQTSLIYNYDLIIRSDHALSITYSICSEHDKNFADIFENLQAGKIVDYFNPYHLILLNLRTFINFHLTLKKENSNLADILLIINEEKLKNQLNTFDEKELQNIINEIHNEKSNILAFLSSIYFDQILSRNVISFWDKSYIQMTFSSMGTKYIYPLYRKITTLIIPLKTPTNIIGSFFIDYRVIEADFLGNPETLKETLLTTENFYISYDIKLKQNISLIDKIIKQFNYCWKQKKFNRLSLLLKTLYLSQSSQNILHKKHADLIKSNLNIITSIQKKWKTTIHNKNYKLFNLFLKEIKQEYLFLFTQENLKCVEERIFKDRKKISNSLSLITKWDTVDKSNYNNNFGLFCDIILEEYHNDSVANKLKRHSKEHLIAVNILNNGNMPAIILQCEDSPYPNIFLHNLFHLLNNDIEKFFHFMSKQVVLNKNVFFSQELLDSWTIETKTELKQTHNKQVDISKNLIGNVMSNFVIDRKEICFYMQGRPYYLEEREEEFKVVFNTLKIFTEIHQHVLYIELTLGNKYSYSIYYSLTHKNYLGKTDSDHDELLAILNSCDNIDEYWEDNTKKITEINKKFNSCFGYHYYEYLNELPDSISNIIKNAIAELGNVEDIDLENYLLKNLNNIT